MSRRDSPAFIASNPTLSLLDELLNELRYIPAGRWNTFWPSMEEKVHSALSNKSSDGEGLAAIEEDTLHDILHAIQQRYGREAVLERVQEGIMEIMREDE